jgi:hypothetical protein
VSSIRVEGLGSALAVPGDGQAYYLYPGAVSTAQVVAPFKWATLLVNWDVAVGHTAVFSFEVSPDGITWFSAYLQDLQTAQNVWTQAANITVNGGTVAAIAAFIHPTPYLRVKVVNANGHATGALTWLILS